MLICDTCLIFVLKRFYLMYISPKIGYSCVTAAKKLSTAYNKVEYSNKI